MKDERIQKELNKIKGIVLFITVILVLLISTFKLITRTYSFDDYYIEVYILSIALITFLLRITVFNNSIDERIQQTYEKTLGISFLAMLYGGFALHFYSVSKQLANSLISINFTSTLLLVGTVVYIYLLKKRKLYANYKWIEEDKKIYRIKIFKNLLIFSLIFLLNILFYVINQSDIIIGLLTIVVSLLSLSILYLLFSFYEKNQYDESYLLEIGQKRALTKNASLFLIIPVLYQFAYVIVNFIYTQQVLFTGSELEATKILLVQRVLGLAKLDISLMTMLSFLAIYFYIKLAIPKLHNLLQIIKIFIITSLIMSVTSYALFSISPILFIVIDFELAVKIIIITTYVNISFMIIILAINILIGLKLKAKRVNHTYMFFIFAFGPVIANVLNRYAVIYKSSFLALLVALASFGGFLFLFMFFKSHEKTITDFDQSLLEI